MALFLIPAAIYGIMFFGRHFPKSEASEKGLSFGEMIKDVGILGGLVVCGLLVMFCQGILGLGNTSSLIIGAVLLIAVGAITKGAIGHWMLFMLFVVHALVGAVELGTDNWIQNITGNILTSEQGKWLFVFTSLTMFALRFCANFIEKRIGLSPLGILLTCAILACVGLNLTSGIATFGGAMLALTVYAVGKTFSGPPCWRWLRTDSHAPARWRFRSWAESDDVRGSHRRSGPRICQGPVCGRGFENGGCRGL